MSLYETEIEMLINPDLGTKRACKPSIEMIQTGSLDGAWVAVQVHVNRELVAAGQLALRGYDSFAAYSAPESVAHQKRPQLCHVLFPGYVFCRYRTAYEYRIVEAPGVIRIVGCGKTPVAIPPHEIFAIQKVIASRLHPAPWQSLCPGQPVQVYRGPLSGVVGTLIEMRNRTRLVIGIGMLRKYVAVEVSTADVALADRDNVVPVPVG